MRAVDAFVDAAPAATTLGATVAASAVTLTPPNADAAHDMWGPFGATAYVGVGCWLNWTIDVAARRAYVITTNLGVTPGQAIFVDGVNVGNSGAGVTLSAGLHGVHVRYLGAQGALALSAVTLTPE